MSDPGHMSRFGAKLEVARKDEHGQGLVEYAFMLLLVAMAAIATMAILGTSLNDAYQLVADGFP